jgi:hypothetical protein
MCHHACDSVSIHHSSLLASLDSSFHRPTSVQASLWREEQTENKAVLQSFSTTPNTNEDVVIDCFIIIVTLF